MDISQTSSSTGTTSPSRRSSIPVPKRKSSLHLYISNSIVGPSNSSSPSSASSTHGEDHVNEFGGSRADSPSPHSASSSRSATAMSMHNSLYVPRSSAANTTAAAAEINTNEYLQLRENHNRLINKCEESEYYLDVDTVQWSLTLSKCYYFYSFSLILILFNSIHQGVFYGVTSANTLIPYLLAVKQSLIAYLM